MKRRQVLSTLGGTLVGFTLAGCAGLGPGGDEAGNQTPNDTQNETPGGNQTGNETDVQGISGKVGQNIPENLEVVRHSVFENNDWVGVTGSIKNTGDTAYEYVEVEVTLRDGDTVIGEFVDTSEREIDSLPPGEIWQFVVVFEDENLTQATDYTLEVDGARGS